MKLSCTAIQVCPRAGHVAAPSDVRAAVSLHSHSNCSREGLDFVPHLAASIPIVATLLARSIAAYEREYKRAFDFNDYFWRPPLSAAAVIESERRHIEERLDSRALVSLTDHDTLEGPRRLRAAGHGDVPLSLEWSVPFEGTVFHLGIHALSAARADEAERAFAAFTTSGEGDFGEICDWLLESPETFIVLNHPYWDMPRRGGLQHDSTLLAFLRRHRHRVHALELNGYRSWTENRRVPAAGGRLRDSGCRRRRSSRAQPEHHRQPDRRLDIRGVRTRPARRQAHALRHLPRIHPAIQRPTGAGHGRMSFTGVVGRRWDPHVDRSRLCHDRWRRHTAQCVLDRRTSLAARHHLPGAVARVAGYPAALPPDQPRSPA